MIIIPSNLLASHFFKIPFFSLNSSSSPLLVLQIMTLCPQTGCRLSQPCKWIAPIIGELGSSLQTFCQPATWLEGGLPTITIQLGAGSQAAAATLPKGGLPTQPRGLSGRILRGKLLNRIPATANKVHCSEEKAEWPWTWRSMSPLVQKL